MKALLCLSGFDFAVESKSNDMILNRTWRADFRSRAEMR